MNVARSVWCSVGLFLILAGPARAESSNASLGAKVLAMTAFVEGNCRGLTPNYTLIRATLKSMGLDYEDYKEGPRRRQIAVTVQALMDFGQEACDTIWSGYGVNGSAVPGLIERK